MAGGHVGLGLLMLALIGFGEAQRRTWMADRSAGAARHQKRLDPTGLENPVPEPTPDLGTWVPLEENVVMKPNQLHPNWEERPQDQMSILAQRPQDQMSILAQRPQDQMSILAQRPQDQMSILAQRPQDQMSVQLKELLQGPVKKVTWRFPQVPPKPVVPPVPFQLREPVSFKSVAVECGEKAVYVEVKQDFFGTGQLLMPSAFRLGGCGPVGRDGAANVVVFEAELQACNSVLKMTKEELVYSFVLHYNPEPVSDTPIIREDGATVNIKCRYLRKSNVSSSGLLPTWLPYMATMVAEEQLIFSLRLMTDDWKNERPSSLYYLRDPINVEAAVEQFNHVPLRVLVDRCVATPVPDGNSGPRYSIIESHGCLIDAKVSGSSSHFMAQDQENRLQFQLEAFRFYKHRSGHVYITCYLKATPAAAPGDVKNKACSYSDGWRAAFGDDQVCRCCDTSCSQLGGRDVSSDELPMDRVSLGPLLVKEDPADSAEHGDGDEGSENKALKT